MLATRHNPIFWQSVLKNQEWRKKQLVYNRETGTLWKHIWHTLLIVQVMMYLLLKRLINHSRTGGKRNTVVCNNQDTLLDQKPLRLLSRLPSRNLEPPQQGH